MLELLFSADFGQKYNFSLSLSIKYSPGESNSSNIFSAYHLLGVGFDKYEPQVGLVGQLRIPVVASHNV
jgi:hypothetical protein